MKNQLSNVLDLEEYALDKLGWIAETRMRIYTGRQYADPLAIREVERRFHHLNAIVNLFEEEAAERQVA